jgi:hypothetical protein
MVLMVLRAALVCLTLTFSAWSQTPGDLELKRAHTEVEQLRQQVDAGVAPRIKLEQAEAALADAKDAELLSRTLYGKDLTEEQASEMEAAALRRLARRQATVEKTQVLVDAGALPVQALDGPKQEVDWANKEYALVASRAELVSELASMARVEQQVIEGPEIGPAPVMERFDGNGSFTRDDFKQVLLSFEKQFRKPLPISAQGETALHRSLGFDHRDRVDIALMPDSQEGSWLRTYLESNEIPYYAFRSSVPGKATAAHIHIGPPSTRLLRTD